MKITGQILKENREKKQISLSEVSLATKINVKVLIAMENGDADQLPPKTFLRGFVRAYATYLGLDVEQILATYQEESGGAKVRIEEASAVEPTERSKKPMRRDENGLPIDSRNSSVTKIVSIAGIILLLLLIAFFKSKMDTFDSENASGPVSLPTATSPTVPSSSLALAPSVSTASTNVITSGSSTANSGANTSAGAVSAGSSSNVASGSVSGTISGTSSQPPTTKPESSPPSQAPVAVESKAPQSSPPLHEVSSQPLASETAPAAKKEAPAVAVSSGSASAITPKPKKSAEVTDKPTAPTVQLAEKPARQEKPGKAQEILLEALDKLDVEVLVDGEPPRQLKLAGEQVETIKAKGKVVLKLSDGGAVNIIINGVDRGVPGDLGKPLRVDLP